MSVSHAQLKAFHAVAVYGSFTRAAERLFLTQPAVSDQVRKLEERYGVLLFHRNKRSVRLSELGERLLAVTQRLFAIEAEAEELLSASSALQTGTLTLEEEMSRAGLRIRPAIQVEGREASREAVVAGIGVGVVSAAEFGADTRVHALPIVDCQRRLTETLVCLREQRSRRIVETFLDLVGEDLPAPS
ncbi:hypothetical protein IPC379_18805 [Pseudomonas aeruginosa]|uniref:LysR family transcriptional regulator n=1 Tax=Pseudomonas aeruginosa TaxID=287 RepID=UPI000F52922C|nr:LysR family transcriptional regulator [Pseudomonas aeruginosa]RQC23335.1 hypothetical protein IPC379_18805 [Pseudomonas aeruginosa]